MKPPLLDLNTADYVAIVVGHTTVGFSLLNFPRWTLEMGEGHVCRRQLVIPSGTKSDRMPYLSESLIRAMGILGF